MRPLMMTSLIALAWATAAGASVAGVRTPDPGPVALAATADDPSQPVGDAIQAVPATSASATDASSTVNAGGSATALEEIVVTATRRAERLQQIPVTVTALTASALKASGVTELRNLTQIAPGLNYSRSAVLGQPIIRGVGSTGTSIGDESNVATYIDGVYQADPFSNLIDLVNIQRIEVLRGPQGTVFGRNATGGLINIITPDPSFTTSGQITATYGRLRNDANDVDVRGYVTGPLTDSLAVDFSALYKRDGAYIKDIVHGGSVSGSDNYALRGKVMFKPTDRIKVILTGEYSEQDGSEVVAQSLGRFTRGATVPGFVLPGNWETGNDVPAIFNLKRSGASLRTVFDVGFANLETTGAYNESHTVQQADGDGSNIPVSTALVDVRTKTYSQEVRLLSRSGGRFTWLVGAYAFHLDGDQTVDILNSPLPPAPLVRSVQIAPTVETTSYAGFGEATFEVVDKLFVTGGLRYTTEDRRFSSKLNGVHFLPSRANNDDATRTDSKLTYRVAVRYQLTPKTNLYGSYGTGFKSGVFNTASTILNSVSPETIKAAEIGVKSDLSSLLRVNASAYHYDYSNLQVTARDPVITNLFVLQNAAQAKIYGGEVEVTLVPLPLFNISAFATYTHARYDSFPNAQYFVPIATGGNAPAALDASGRQLIRTPEWTFGLRPSWSHDVHGGQVQFGGNVFYSSRIYWDFANTKAFSTNPYALVSAFAAFEAHKGWRVEVSGTNLFDTAVLQQVAIGPAAVTTLLQRPRRVAISVSRSF